MKIFLLFLFFVLISCNEEKVVFFQVKKKSSFDFIKIRKIDKIEKNVFVADGRYNQVVALDSNLNYINKFGRKGQGPGELAQLYNILIDNYRSRILMRGLPGKIQSWSVDGIFQTEYLLEYRISDATRFAVDRSGALFFSTPSKKTAILKWEPESDSTYFIGENIYSKTLDLVNNYHHILYDDSLRVILQVGFTNASFICYNESGEVLYTKDLSRFGPLKPAMESWKLRNAKNKQGTTAILFFDACLLKDNLYLLYHENTMPKIIRFRVNRKSLEYIETINLNLNEKTWVEMFTMLNEDTLIMVNSLSEKVYLLKGL